MGGKPAKPKDPPKTGGGNTKPTGDNKTKTVKEIKLLLLGSGESGKSTFFKQIKAIHDPSGYTDEEIQAYKSSIYANLLHCMKGLCTHCMKKDNFENEENFVSVKF